MDAETTRREIFAFDPEIPIERAWTPPSSWYTTRAVHDIERRAVWSKTWQFAALAQDVAQPGDFCAVDIAGQPIVVQRDQDGTLRAFHNVCRHHASVMCAGRGNQAEIVCPYHGWRYKLDGGLKSAPMMAGIEDFDRDAMGLPALAVVQWGHWIFVNASASPEPFLPLVGELNTRLQATSWTDLVYAGRREWRIGCNWKAFCDNYLDGGYHIPHMHPSLDAQLAMKSYTTEVFGQFNIQSADAGSGRRDDVELDIAPDSRIGDGALYAWLYPNFMLNRYGPVLDINVVRPTGPQECLVTFDWWFDAGCDEAFIAQSMAQTVVTQDEDIIISEKVQAGLRSDAYVAGRYAPRLEIGAHHFHRLLSADLRGAV